ncbi:hypothetical protein RB215_10255 [Pseudoalteromonas sp. HL-AS2]|uniref:hypothetical protein n=1 Tax=unclassified Pseudoalteromonas TaxID=194690 RepID=UPI001AD61B96|nr:MULTISPECIES: hypothetical protein [unclassified Pseudoalteromonas]MBO7925578.1 hypothetical protein [Pseudoalteromonas sp. K222D]WMS93646.1 hypothetical protein RB215_10255 [Pseudoalteromonas sp. HL-AS2]
MHLGKLYSRFECRYRSYKSRIYQIQQIPSSEQWKFNYCSEVLISDIWQSWSAFSRELIFSSCRGTVARNGDFIQERTTTIGNCWKRLGYESSRFLRNNNLSDTGHNSFLIRKEPTWGDIENVPVIVDGLSPNNKSNLISSFGSFSQLKDLQLVRNACAHKNVETISDLYDLAGRYSFVKITTPTDLAWSHKKGTTELAIDIWLEEMLTIANLTTEKR